MICPECGKKEFIIEIEGQIEYKKAPPTITYLQLKPGIPMVCKHCKTILRMKPETAVSLEEEIQKSMDLDLKIY